MINFKEHEGKLFLMLDEPTLLTPDAKMPCLVRLIQDDSPMGKYNKDMFGYDPERLTPRICTEVIDVNDLSDHNRGSARCDGLISIQYYHYELIGTFVEEGSAEWACYQMMKGEKVTKGHLEHIYWHYDARPHLQCISEYNCGTLQIMVTPEIWIKTADKDGWQIYKEPKEEPKLPKEPIANCENCKHVCTNSNIDHCQMYEPKPKSKKIIHGHIPADMRPEYFHLCKFKVGDWVECNGNQHLIESISRDLGRGNYYHFAHGNGGAYAKSIRRKLSPSEIVVRIGCLEGTVEDLSYADNGRFFLVGKVTERHPVGMYSILYEEMLDAPTRELVESLIKGQEEE